MMRGFPRIWLAAALVAAIPSSPVLAEPKVTQKTRYYDLTATTISGLRQELASKGPKGFWAYTDWYVRWTGSCKLTVEISYTLPRHRKLDALDAQTRQSLTSMLDALTRHEYGHGAFAIRAAQDIEKDRCRNGKAILNKHIAAEKAYDANTKHGMRDGVVLK